MANNNMFIAPIYSIGANAAVSGGVANARYLGFPSQSVFVQPAPAGTVFNTVTVNSIITLLPFGTVVNPIKYGTNKTVAEIVTLANA